MAIETHMMSAEDLRRTWVGRLVRRSTDDAYTVPSRRVEDIHYTRQTGEWVAWSGEHHICGSPEALDRRLAALATPARPLQAGN